MLWWILGSAVVATAGLLAWGSGEGSRVCLVHYTVHSNRLPPAFDGLRLAHLSDVHYSARGRGEKLALKLILDSQPDLVLFTGDLLGNTESAPMALTYLGEFRGARGTLGVLGNHDRKYSLTEDWLPRELSARGVQVLFNESVCLCREQDALWIVGVDDPDKGFDRVGRALAAVPEDEFKVMLAHSPKVYQEAVDAGVDLLLSGHTHGGQIQIPGVPPVFTNVDGLPHRLAEGLSRLSERTTLIVSHGTGLTWPPIRLFCPPEVGLIELRRG